MKIRILKSEGGDMESDITRRVSGLMLLVGCLAFIFCGFMIWQLFSPQIKNVFYPARAERMKIAMHDEKTFQQLRQKHGKVNTGVVIYEADGKVWYYKDGQKVNFK